MMRRSLLAGLLAFPCHMVMAGTSVSDALDAGKSFGSDALGQTQSYSTHQDASGVPNYQGADVPETRYANNPMSLEDEARTQVNQSDTGSFVTDSATTRPQFQFNTGTDPLLTRSAAVEASPETFAGAISGEYSGCQTSVISIPPEYTQERCTEWRESYQDSCQESLQVTCNRPVECDAGGILLQTLAGDMAWNYTYPTLTLGTQGDNIWGGYCAIYDRSTTFTIENIDKVNEFVLTRAGFDDWIRIMVNNHLVYVGPYGGDRLEVVDLIPGWNIKGVQYTATNTGGCELSTSWNQALNIDIKPYLVTGTNIIDMRVIVAGGGEGWIQFRATQYCDCEWSESWQNDCSHLDDKLGQGLCLQPTSLCLEPNETQIIGGMAVYRDCWRYEKRYTCASSSTTEEDYCAQLRNKGCTQIGSQCTGMLDNGLCESFEQTYQCQTSPGSSREILDCGGQTLCLDGGCFDTAYEPSQDFGVAASSLGVINDAAADVSIDASIIFQGEDLRCSKAILGYSNCCKLNGWGQDIGLAQCSSNEQRLALSRQAGLCHSVGSYCSNKNLLGCTSRKETYCCFKSKLARIIQEQGRAQLGLSWGSAKNPDCSGITLEQLQSLDFSRIDFSEFYADAMDKANSPGSAELQGIIQNYLQQSMQ